MKPWVRELFSATRDDKSLSSHLKSQENPDTGSVASSSNADVVSHTSQVPEEARATGVASEHGTEEEGAEKPNDKNLFVDIFPVPAASPLEDGPRGSKWKKLVHKMWKSFKFIGPGFMVAVAYMDPGNYSTDVNGGAQFQYKLLFVVLLSTIIALYLQTLAIKLGTVTGKDLARGCHDHLPRWMSWILWIFAECAILATDVAEVAGSAIALNILGGIPLIAGVFITIADVLLVLLAYGPENGMRTVRALEYGVITLVMVVFVCFCIILGRIPHANVGWVFKGYLPSSSVVSASGIQASAGILGATVMPHSLYLGSSQVIPRVRDYDIKAGYSPQSRNESVNDYTPSFSALKSTIRYSVIELFAALLSIALFVNSAILIAAGDTLFNKPEGINADLFSLNDTLTKYLGKDVATVFYVALLASGLSAGVICTIAGQVVSEGHINWKTKPWLRRLVTRVITLIPCVVVVACLGREGINAALNWSQIVLTITLPFLASPLVYLTSRSHIMRVKTKYYQANQDDCVYDKEGRDCSNGWVSIIFGTLVCIFIFIANVYLMVQVGLTGSAV